MIKNGRKSKQSVKRAERVALNKADKLMSAEKKVVTRVAKRKVNDRPRAMPIARPAKETTRAPKVKSTKTGTYVTHSEFIVNVPGSEPMEGGLSPFKLISRRINPGLSLSFPWLSGMGKQYTNYRVVKMSHRYVPFCPTTVEGSIRLGYQYDSTKAYPETYVDLMQYMGSKSVSPSVTAKIIYRRQVGVTDVRNIANDDEPNPNEGSAKEYYSDINLVDSAVLQVAIDGVYNQNGTLIPTVGAIFCDYVVELLAPGEVGNGIENLQLALYTETSNNSHPFIGYDSSSGYFKYSGGFDNVRVNNATANQTSELLFDVYSKQPVMFTLTYQGTTGSVVSYPTLYFNGVQLVYGTDAQYYLNNDTPASVCVLGQFIVLPSDELSPNKFAIDASTTTGIQDLRFEIYTSWYPFRPINGLLSPQWQGCRQGLLSTVPEKNGVVFLNKLKKFGWDNLDTAPEPIKFKQIPQLTKLKEKSYPMKVGDKFQLPDIEDLAVPTKLEQAMADARARRQSLARTPSDTKIVRPKLYNITEAFASAASFAELAEQYPWVQTCTEPLRIPRLASVLTDTQMMTVGAALGSKENNTFDEILDTVSKVTELGTKIFTMFG